MHDHVCQVHRVGFQTRIILRSVDDEHSLAPTWLAKVDKCMQERHLTTFARAITLSRIALRTAVETLDTEFVITGLGPFFVRARVPVRDYEALRVLSEWSDRDGKVSVVPVELSALRASEIWL